jgi:transcriptional regulator with XRE-family HTH domain
MEYVGQLIRYHRGRLGLTQEELAEKARVSPATVVRMEAGQIERPRIATLQSFAGALGVDPAEFLQLAARAPDEHPEPVEASGGTFTAVYQRDGDWWIGYVEELPGANAQERTLEEARESLREAVSDVLEANRELTRTEFEGRDVVREPLSV